MKNKNRLILIFSVLIVSGIILSSCANEKDKIEQKNSNEEEERGEAVKYSAQGKIVKIDEKGIHILVKDKVQRYNVEKGVAQKHYVGEYVGINELNNKKYEVELDGSYDYKKRSTSTGEQIKRITGTVGEVKDDLITAVTEMGDIRLTNPGNFNLKNGAQVMFDYVEMAGGNQMVSFYEEASKINAKVIEISRDAVGTMRIYAKGKDDKEYDVKTNENTVTNFAYSELKKDDNITVYPEEISGDTPSSVNPKLIIKD